MAGTKITETVIIIKFADGSSLLRGVVPMPEFTEADMLSMVQAIARAESVRVLGEIEGFTDISVVTDCDYDTDGAKVRTKVRPIGQTSPVFPLCDCGKGAFCPQFGTANAAVAR